ncbi:MAG: hypothetical protein M3Y18_05535 [Candidatus Eremiobacteraeota bacterium]|nr:hypothetical protein [Candidatus Eremiobacteraeota bacterium]
MKSKGERIRATVGFAADERGEGIAYARVARPGTSQRGALVRVPFRLQRMPALLDREIGYAALTAVATHLKERGVERVGFVVDDPRLVEDLRERRDVPQPLGLPYVRLGCALNQFREYDVAPLPGDGSDLSARARAEVAMHIAA